MNLEKPDLEYYIKQIKSYKAQVNEIEISARKEYTLKERHPDRILVLIG